MRDLAIRNTHPTVVTIISGTTGTTALDENGNTVQLNEAQVTTELARLQAEFEAKDYQRKRVVEYPSIGDQLDALFHAGVFPSDMAAQIQAIKDKYPKA
jgi:hypothetical protein